MMEKLLISGTINWGGKNAFWRIGPQREWNKKRLWQMAQIIWATFLNYKKNQKEYFSQSKPVPSQSVSLNSI